MNALIFQIPGEVKWPKIWSYLTLDAYDYEEWFKNEDEESADIPSIPPLEGNREKVEEGKRFKMLIPNKLLTRLLISFAEIKAGNNSYKLKN